MSAGSSGCGRAACVFDAGPVGVRRQFVFGTRGERAANFSSGLGRRLRAIEMRLGVAGFGGLWGAADIENASPIELIGMSRGLGHFWSAEYIAIRRCWTLKIGHGDVLSFLENSLCVLFS